jgi:hypothetical protein
MRRSAVMLGVALGVLAPTPAAADDDPPRVTPEKKSRKERRAQRRTKDMSDGGTNRGIIEFMLGGVTAAGSLALIGRGAWELVQGQRTVDECNDPDGRDLDECFAVDPARPSKIAAGLSFAFAVPMAVASGLLFGRAARIRRDHRKFHAEQARLSLVPVAGRRGGGLQLFVRF